MKPDNGNSEIGQKCGECRSGNCGQTAAKENRDFRIKDQNSVLGVGKQ